MMPIFFFLTGSPANDTKTKTGPTPPPSDHEGGGGPAGGPRARARRLREAVLDRPGVFAGLAAALLAGLLVGVLLAAAKERLPHDADHDFEPPYFRIFYLGGPGDELVLEHTYPYPGQVYAYAPSVTAARDGLVELGNWTLDPGAQLAWDYRPTKGIVQLFFFQPTQAEPVATKLAWIGNATVVIADTPTELLDRARPKVVP